MPEPDRLRDQYSPDEAASAAVVEVFRSLGGDEAGLEGAHDLVAATTTLVLRPPGRRRSLDEAAADVGLDPAIASLIWAGLGFATEDGDLSDDEVAMLEGLGVTAALVGEAGTVELSRVVGLSMRQLAEATVAAVRVGFEIPRSSAEDGARPGRDRLALDYHDLIGDQLPGLVVILDVTLRRHLAEIVPRLWAPDDSLSVTTRETVICFADLVGFTSWSARASEADLTRALDHFEATVWSAAAATGVKLIKLIGDEAMFTAATIDQAVEAARVLAGAAPGPATGGVRIGIARGRVIARAGDLFGTVVNQAARLAVVAEPGTALVGGSAVSDMSAAEHGIGPAHEVDLAGFDDAVPARAVRL